MTNATNSVSIFQHSITKYFQNIVNSVSEEEFIDALGVVKRNGSTGRKLHRAMIEELCGCMNSEFEDILNEGSLKEAITTVSKLVENTDLPVGVKAWRPPGDVKRHLRSLDAESIKEESEILEKQVLLLESENDALMRDVSEKRKKVNALNKRMTRILNEGPRTMQQFKKVIKELENCHKTFHEASGVNND